MARARDGRPFAQALGNPELTDWLRTVPYEVVVSYADIRLKNITQSRYDHLNDYEFFEYARKMIALERIQRGTLPSTEYPTTEG